jgi:hypothetical protein
VRESARLGGDGAAPEVVAAVVAGAGENNRRCSAGGSCAADRRARATSATPATHDGHRRVPPGAGVTRSAVSVRPRFPGATDAHRPQTDRTERGRAPAGGSSAARRRCQTASRRPPLHHT